MISFVWSNGDNICNHLSGVMEITYAIIFWSNEDDICNHLCGVMETTYAITCLE